MNSKSDCSILPSGDLTGKTIPLQISNRYYDATVELLVDTAAVLRDWSAEFFSHEMLELRNAVDGVIYVFESINDAERDVLAGIVSALNEVNADEEGDVVEKDSLLFGVPVGDDKKGEDWEAVGDDIGLEMVQFKELEENEYREKLGTERIWELLECYEWDINRKQQEKEEEKEEEEIGAGEDEFGEFCEFGDMTDLLSRLSVMKSTVAGLEEDQKHEVAMKFINDLLR
jgi:hypothetical protein